MRKHGKRLFSLLLSLVMALSLLPAPVSAGGGQSATWTKVELADIQSTDIIAITMHASHTDKDYVLRNDGGTSTKGSASVWDASNTDNTTWQWNIVSTDGGYTIYPAGKTDSWLYCINDNNGLRVGNGNATVWSLDDASGYLKCTDPGGDTRYMGVYDNNNGNNITTTPNFRTYKNTTGNTKNQTLAFYKLTSTSGGETPVDPDPVDPTPTPDPTPVVESGEYVIWDVTIKKAMSSQRTYDGSYYYKGVDVTETDGVLSGYGDTEIWTVTGEDGKLTFTAGEEKLGMSGTYNSISNATGCTTWVPEDADDGAYYIKNTETGKYIMFNTQYSSWQATADKASASKLKLTKPTEVVDPTPTPTYNTIAEALAGEKDAEFTVKGVVTLLDGQNIYLQDATGGIDLRLSAYDGTIKLGDTLIGTGKRDTYNGLPQLGSGTYEKSEGLTLSAKKTTIGALTTADICTYVTIKNVEVTEVYDNNGEYKNPNITVKDSDGNSIQLYKAVINKDSNGNWEYKVGDKLDITAAVSYYQKNNTGDGKFQLRNTNADEVKIHAKGIIEDGSYVVYNASAGKAMSSEATGTYYRAGKSVTLEDGKVKNATNDIIWSFTFDGEYYTITTQDGNKLSMNNDKNSLPLDEVNDKWTIAKATTDGCYYLINATRKGTSGDPYYVEWYAGTSKNGYAFEEFSTYFYKSANEAIYAMQLIPTEVKEIEVGELPNVGDKVVLYNQNAQAVLAGEGDTQSINKALATITDGVATEVANGGVVFTVEKNGDYYRFKNERYGYLCSNGTGNNAFYSKDFSEEGVTTNDADWLVRTCSGGVGGYEIESRTAKYNGTYSQWLEYYSDSFKTYSMYKVTDYTIYSFYFYPLADGIKTEKDVVNDPKIVVTSADSVMLGNDYELTFYLDDINEYSVQDITVTIYETGKEYGIDPVEGETNSFRTVLDAADFVGKESVTVAIQNGGNYSTFYTVTVVDEPSVGAVTPASNSQTGEKKKPVISAEIVNAGENPTLTMTVNGETVNATYSDGKLTYTPAADLTDGRTTVVVTVTRQDGKTASKTWSFTVGESSYQLYFGQLHSHTGQYSDGSGTLAEALSYVKNLPASANVQFVAFTDHSNYFDGSKVGGTANPEGALYDMSLASTDSQNLWNAYKKAVANFNEANKGEIVALAGFEMTWSGGPGHINTFNTPGIVSRNNTTLNNKTADAGIKAYYALLSQEEGKDSISQFNHPGTTFGNFIDFSYWDAVIDSRIYLLEVGNGEGQIGAGGYYPSYEQYIMALDKGWHVAPTNNQDNHKGRWGNANDARDVILTDNFTEEGIYEAIRSYRLYATEDKNLEITYTVNDLQMGSIISTDDMPEKLNFNVTVYDPDNSDSIAKVELVVNSGKVAYTWSDPAELASGELTATLDPTYSYYFVRVTQGDGDLAVTAPVWVGESLKLGISEVTCDNATPITDEAITLTTTLFNSEDKDATVKSITYSVGNTVIGTDSTGYTISKSSTQTVEFKYTPTVAKVMTVTVTAVLTLDDEDYTFTKDIELDITDASKLVYIGIDASHYNEYVAGKYKDSMGNFSNMAGEYGIRTVELKTSEDFIAACSNPKYKAIIMTAPSRRLEAAQKELKVYTAEEIAAIKAFNERGGTVIMAGWSDHYEYDPEAFTSGLAADKHMAATQNAVLEALGSSLRISDDATYDDVYSAIDGCDAWRLYFNTYNFENFLVDGVEVGEGDNAYSSLYTEKFSHYGGASIYTVDGTLPATVSPVVYAHHSTYSVDVDKDGLGGTSTPKYAYAEGDDRLMVMATEKLEGKGLIVVSGAAFMSNFEVQATVSDNGSEKNYSNHKICENLLAYLNPVTVTDIADVQAETEEGVKFTIEGIVTSNASGYDADTAFFDCIYLQDGTAGINAFPVAGNYKIGDKVRITGTTSSYQGERQIAVTSIEKLGEATPVEPTVVTADQLENKGYLGTLVTVEGTATKVEYANGLLQTIMVRDSSGKEARIFIDGYITTAKDVENVAVGCHVVATGLASYDNTFTLEDGTPVYQRIRIRDRADIVCTAASYTRVAYPITLNTYGGTIRSGNVTSYYPGEAVTLPTDVVREGYTFLGWFTSDGERVTAIGKNESGPKNFFAHWKQEEETPVIDDLPFVDVSKESDWFYADVEYVYQNGLMIGTGNGTTFAPNATLDRAQLVTILYRMAGSPDGAAACAFPDVLRGQWYTAAVDWAVENGIVKGYDNGLFGTTDPVTREQLATMLFRYAVYSGMDFVTLAENLGGFADVDEVSPYAVSALNWAVGAGLIKGTDDNRLLPGDNASRAQVAAIIHRYLSALEG